MKLLLMDGIEFFAEKPAAKPEQLLNCLIAFVTCEKKDKLSRLPKVVSEIEKVALYYSKKAIAIIPFAHLSSSLASPTKASHFLQLIEEQLSLKFCLLFSEFGVEKGLKIQVRTSMDNIKYREY